MRFVGTPPSTYFPVDPNKRSTPQKAADAFLVLFARKLDGTQRTVAECNAILIAINGGIVGRSYKIVPGLTLVNLPANLTVEKGLVVFKNAAGFWNRKNIIGYKRKKLRKAINIFSSGAAYI